MASSEETRLDIPPYVHEISEEEEKEEADDGLIGEVEMEAGNKMVETFLLMSTVIAGSCYAAMLILSDNFGRLSDPTTLAYLLFVFFNLVAVFSAVLTVVSIIWSYFLDRKSAGRALEFSATFLAFAMLSMSSAVSFGAAVVVKKSKMIQLAALAFGTIFCVIVYRFNTRWRQMMRLMGGRGRAHAR